ncbi:hypothetical protein [Ochrobactrum sp. BTU1]|uniref:hypothetical protein n=1 Tax=Ochrobactrum sp. BTU1 TaxID=2840456 RepID=UPI001C03C83F|nr:hypothetical protein KMS41_26070 [Ochrobactrum sp. BTU1]
MHLQIIRTTGKSIPNDKRYLHELDETEYGGIQVGDIYNVYGLMIIHDRVDALISPDDGRPLWIPQYIFEMQPEDQIKKWNLKIIDDRDEYKYLKYSFGVVMLMGYSRLLESYHHYLGILEGDRDELDYFYNNIK